jgi:type IV pilus assembly protein PilB
MNGELMRPPRITGTPRGLTSPSSREGRGGFLSDVIVELGFTDRETVDQAVREARTGTTVARVLVDSGAVTEEQLARAMAERYGLDHVDLERFPVDPAATNLIKPSAAKRYNAVPIGFADGGALLVAMADPADALGVNDIAVMTKLEVRPAVASREAIGRLVARLPLPEAADAAAPAAPPPAPEPEPEPEPEPARTVFWQVDDSGEATTSARPPELPAEEGTGPQLGGVVPATPSGDQDVIRALREELESERGARVELARVQGELDALRAELADVRAKAARVGESAEELAEARGRAEAAERKLAEAQHLSEEARRRVRDLEEADRRAEHARLALAELREETERQREQHTMIEKELRTRVATEERRRRLLEERLSEIEESSFASERAFEEMGLAQRRMRAALRALAEPDEAA